MRQILDAQGRVKYTVIEQPGMDAVTIQDSQGQLLYRYSKSANITTDKNGILVLRGSILFDLK